MTTKKILIVDDEEIIHKTLKKILNSASLELSSAYNGLQALEMAESEFPDLILLDINMPKMDGNEVMRELRKNPKTRSIPVIMLTGNGEVIDRVVGYELGVQDYVTKPFDVKDFKSRIECQFG
ncbi:MAG: response regulator [Elusimicrobia bacterium]|nr:response regulator [Candidatus Obscuribacterium magneticum]